MNGAREVSHTKTTVFVGAFVHVGPSREDGLYEAGPGSRVALGLVVFIVQARDGKEEVAGGEFEVEGGDVDAALADVGNDLG
jgi:hypothetical protein